jgi:hypothetical protein
LRGLNPAPNPHAAVAHLRTAAWVFSALAAVALVLSFVFAPESLPALEVCSFRAFTGLPCPGCGLTRGFCAVSHGHFREATGFHAFSVPLYGLALLLLLGPVLVRCFPGLADRRAQTLLGRSAWFLAALLGGYGIWRMIHLWGRG